MLEPDHLAVVGRREAEVGLLIAFSTAGIREVSQAWITMVLGSGADGVASWAMGCTVPYASTRIESSSATFARPVRTPANSRVEQVHRRLHPGLHVLERILHGRYPLGMPASADTTEPTGSPLTIRTMLPGRLRSNTTIGSLLSMHSEIAVVSITSSPRLSTSM